MGTALGTGEKAENRRQPAHSNDVGCLRVNGVQKQETLQERRGNDLGEQGSRWGWDDRATCHGKEEGPQGGEVEVHNLRRKGGALRPPVKPEGRRVFARRETEGSWAWVGEQEGGRTRGAAWGANTASPKATAEKLFLNCFCPWCANHSLTLGHLPRAPEQESICLSVWV